MPESSAFAVELAIEKLKSYKSQGTVQIPELLIKAGVEKFVMTSIHVLFIFRIRRHCLKSGSSR